jgi:hypothetical protein
LPRPRSRVSSTRSRGDHKKETLAKIVDLSVTSRVISPYTALVVLETEQDYQRFGLSRRGLAAA